MNVTETEGWDRLMGGDAEDMEIVGVGLSGGSRAGGPYVRNWHVDISNGRWVWTGLDTTFGGALVKALNKSRRSDSKKRRARKHEQFAKR